MYFNYLLEGSKTVEMCLKTMFLYTCHHLSHFSADFGGPYLNQSNFGDSQSFFGLDASFCQDV